MMYDTLLLLLLLIIILNVNSMNSINSNITSILNYTKERGILCFGDSLTKGLSPEKDEWEKYHPYSIQLSRLINNHFNNVTNIKVVDDGVNGEMTSIMNHRITLILSKTLYDVVIVLGGTNDLGHHRSKDEILNDIYEIHSTVHNFGIKSNRTIVTFAMTIPPLEWKVDETVRAEVNNALREYVNKNITKTFLIDIDKVLTTTHTDRKYYCPDNVHFSPEGYDLIGELVFSSLKENSILLA